MDTKSVFSARTVAALALVGSAATLMPSLSFDLGRRPFPRSGSVLSCMPSSLLEQPARARDALRFSIAADAKAAGHDGGSPAVFYAASDSPPPPTPRVVGAP